jgi:hypothetical protein
MVPNSQGGIAYVSGVNGGIFKTVNFNVSSTSGTSIQWVPVTDQQDIKCTSISAIGIGLSTPDTVFATCGRPSNYMSYGSELWGAMISTDGGKLWNMVPTRSGSSSTPGSGSGLPFGFYLTSAIVSGASGSTLLVAARSRWQGGAFYPSSSYFGIWRSTDSGQTWGQPVGISPTEKVFAMERDPNDDTFIVAVGTLGVYVSSDSGATFSQTTSGAKCVCMCDR